ncbi:MAG: M36 family metallopeptidase [Actinocatenispora sp.]
MAGPLTPRRSRTRGVLAAGLVAGLAVAALGTAPAAQAAPDHLTLVGERHSLLATHYWYQQTYGGHPVLDAYYVRHVNTKTGATTVDDGRAKISSLARTAAAVSRDKAASAATTRSPGAVRSNELSVLPGRDGAASLVYSVVTGSAHGSVRTVVDAGSGKVREVQNLVKEADGTGQVFNPNAVVTLQDESLTDDNNADSPAFADAYKQVTLTNLDGSGTLSGDFATDVNKKKKRAHSAADSFVFNRSQGGFEETMAYFHLTEAQKFIQANGFTDVNNEAQDFATVGLSDDNSFYDPSADQITYGTGGVDDAEDAEVIWHEYGHAIQDAQVPGFGSSEEAGAIGEGFGDYWAYTMSITVSTDTATTPLACIADWDAVSYTSDEPHCLRRLDGTKSYPGDLDGEVHDDGEIWSRALFDVHNALGQDKATKVVLESQFNYTPDTSMPEAAQNVVDAADSLYGATAAQQARQAFVDRGILS